jgi:secreted trypsin-like serine protease
MMRVRSESLVRARSWCILLGRSGALGAAGLALCFAACGQLPNDATATQSASGVSQTQSAIVGGTADNTDTAVMALVHQISSTGSTACSGTTIAVVGASAIFLTAAHCVVGNDGMDHVTLPVMTGAPSSMFVLPGPDWMTNFSQNQYFGVTQVAVHPCYDGTVNSPYDVALVRYVGALPSTPIIPAITPAEDKLAVGTALTVIGFGKTSANDNNSQRFEVTRSIASITSQQFIYSQTDNKGACEGDSGGPVIVQTADGARVAGVTSFGDPNCDMEGASVRVSPMSAFIAGFIASAPQTLSCDECSLASVGPGNACINQGIICGESTSPCGKFLACAGTCTTSACINQCASSNAQGASQYNAVVDCQCGGACQTACSKYQACGGTQTDPGPPASTFHPTCGSLTTGAGGAAGASGTAGASGGTAGASGGTAGASGTAGVSGGSAGAGSAGGCGLTDPRAACESCVEDTCCTQASACAADASCALCLKTPTSACGTSFAYNQLMTCFNSCAGTPCAGSNPTTGTAGGAGNGTSGGGGEATGSSGSAGGKSGCGCDVSPTPGRSSGLALLIALGLVVSRSRARRR